MERSLRESLGLVALSTGPSAGVFIMRLFIFFAEFLAHCPESSQLLEPFHALVRWEPWQYSLALVALFNEHEGLIYKGLLGLLSLELDAPELISPYSRAFCSCRVYEDLLLRCDWDASYFDRGLEENNIRMLTYLHRLYTAVSEGLLFEQDLVNDESSASKQRFHRDLLARIRTLPHCTPLVESLQAALQSHSSDADEGVRAWPGLDGR